MYTQIDPEKNISMSNFSNNFLLEIKKDVYKINFK